MNKTDEHFILDEQDEHWAEVEGSLVEDVRHWWRLSRQGPHDECDCYWYYVQSLRTAIRRLRSWRTSA